MDMNTDMENLLHEMILHYKDPGLLLLQFVTDIIVTIYDWYVISVKVMIRLWGFGAPTELVRNFEEGTKKSHNFYWFEEK